MMRRAASRTRDPDPEEEAPAPVAVAQPIAPVATTPAMPAPVATASSVPAQAVSDNSVADVEKGLVPIAQRKPAKPLSDIDRRKRALSNVEKISAALLARYKNTGSMPATYVESSGGIKTLSWRVGILPELGYSELYSKFNPEEPWDGPNNIKLLEFIPDEFVSPERFDTSTNYLLPGYNAYMFARPGFTFTGDTDPQVNTLMLLEVDDSYSTPWTAPQDYYRGQDEVKLGLGNLREDGTFAVWANGLPTLISKGVNWQELHNALSCEAGDGQRAGQIHRSISIGEVTEPSVAADSNKIVPMEEKTQSPVSPIVRESVPNELVLADAGKKLRDVFVKKMADANNDEKKVHLANEMLEEASKISGDSASAFVLITAAGKLASQAGDLDTVLRGVDTKVSRFEVDAYEVNVSALSDFGTDNANRDSEKVNGSLYLKRTLPVTFAAITADDYLSASMLVRHAYKFTGQPRSEELPKALSLLRNQLASAQRNYEMAKGYLASYRIDSSDGNAASTFGKFLVFVKGDWDGGLPLVALGGNEALRELALADIRGATTASEMIHLGDSWWDLSSLAKTGSYRQASRDRATYWYQKALANLPESLDKIHVKGRIDEAGDATKGSPLAILRQLAADTNVDLTIGLAAIADSSYRQQPLGNTDEE